MVHNRLCEGTKVVMLLAKRAGLRSPSAAPLFRGGLGRPIHIMALLLAAGGRGFGFLLGPCDGSSTRRFDRRSCEHRMYAVQAVRHTRAVGSLGLVEAYQLVGASQQRAALRIHRYGILLGTRTPHGTRELEQPLDRAVD
jgi:hypothetical protein